MMGMQTTIKGVVYEQFGHPMAVVQMPMRTLKSFFKVDPEVQRELSPARRKEIRDFIISSLEKGVPFYFSPLVYSARGKMRAEGDTLVIEPGHYLYLIDGMHRTTALLSAISYLETEAMIAEELNRFQDAEKLRTYVEALENYPVAMQIYLDLSIEQEKQAFTDKNHERKEIQGGQILQYDQRDEYSRLTMQVANKLQGDMEIELIATRLTEKMSAVTNITVMRKVYIALFEGILTQKTGQPYYRNCNPKDVPLIAETFYTQLYATFDKKMGNRNQYVIGLSGIQISLAYLVFHLVRELRIPHLEAIHQIQLLTKHCTFQHDDPLFSFMYDPDKQQLKSHSSTTTIKKLMLAFHEILHKEREGS